MTARTTLALVLGLATIAGLAAPPGPWAAREDEAAAGMDEGRIDTAWFGQDVQFRETDEVDYLWIKPGFTLEGRTFLVKPWDVPVWLAKDRDARDSAHAEELTRLAGGHLKAALATELRGKAKASLYQGDVVVQGRFVDVRVGGKGAGFAGAATWDVKFTDKATGDLLLAAHHRSLNATMFGKLSEKVWSWMTDFGGALRYEFPEYAKAKPRKA